MTILDEATVKKQNAPPPPNPFLPIPKLATHWWPEVYPVKDVATIALRCG